MKYCGLVVAAVLIAGGAFGNLLVNADFEAGVTADWSSTPKAWEINSGIWGPGASPTGGNYGSIQTGGNDTSPYLVYQTVTLPAGTPAINFTGNYAGGQLAVAADVGVWVYDGAGVGGTVLDSDFVNVNNQGLGWTGFDLDVAPGSFTADQVTVAFGWQNFVGGWSNGSAAHGDSFDLTAVPEPATMLLGLAGLALLRRRR